MKFLKEIAGHITGTKVLSSEGEYLGKVIEVTKNSATSAIEYLILESYALFGEGSRYFAIPALPTLLKKDNEGVIILLTDKRNLMFAKSDHLDQYPKSSKEFGQLILELHYYNPPEE